MKEVVKNLYQISSKGVNFYVFQDSDKVVLIDTGLPGNLGKISNGLSKIGREISDVTDLVLTHAHPDHTGSVAEILAVNSNIQIHMHKQDAEFVARGNCMRQLKPSGGILSVVMSKMGPLMSPSNIDPINVNHVLEDDAKLQFGGTEMTVIHLPGHSAGMVGLLFEVDEKKVLIAADAVVNMFGLRNIFGYEDPIKGEQSVQKLCEIDFDVACFGHGSAITGNASQVFRERFQF